MPRSGAVSLILKQPAARQYVTLFALLALFLHRSRLSTQWI
jgi:hypothetical protein